MEFQNTGCFSNFKISHLVRLMVQHGGCSKLRHNESWIGLVVTDPWKYRPLAVSLPR